MILVGDCREQLANLDASTVDACVTDPPYELGFMGKKWDASGVAYDPAVWTEVLRVLKPGGFLLAFGGTRTYHRLTCAIEDAGFEVRDSIAAWLYASGFPKSLDVSKAIDKAPGAERQIRVGGSDGYIRKPRSMAPGGAPVQAVQTLSDPVTDDAKRWQGWGTALKPAWEPVIVARKPLQGTVAQNVLAHGVGGLNIDACRVPGSWGSRPGGALAGRSGGVMGASAEREPSDCSPSGRWPANTVLAHHPDCADTCHPDCWVRVLDQQSGNRPSRGGDAFYAGRSVYGQNGADYREPDGKREIGYGDTGGASRFFPTFRYEPKAPTRERPKVDGVAHPTVKPLALIRWLVRLVTPPSVPCLCCSACGRSPDGESGGLRDAAPSRDGGTSGQDARPRRGRPPSQRGQRRQPDREPGAAAEAGARQSAEAAQEADRLPSLPLDDPYLGPCPTCGGRLTARQRPGRVLDPFLGSGTTAEACIAEGFDWVGCELDAASARLIEQRLSKPIQRGLGL